MVESCNLDLLVSTSDLHIIWEIYHIPTKFKPIVAYLGDRPYEFGHHFCTCTNALEVGLYFFLHPFFIKFFLFLKVLTYLDGIELVALSCDIYWRVKKASHYLSVNLYCLCAIIYASRV